MTDTQSPAGRGTTLAFAYVTTLFFAWGFATSLIDPLIAAVRKVFDLSTAEAMLTASAWFIAYAVVSVPAAAVLSKLGYSRSIISALGVMVLGCLIVPVATIMDWYPGVLLALFIIASGVTLLQVAANPLVAALGSKKTSHARLNFSQFFNSLGTTLGPYLGATVLLTGGVFAAGAVVTSATRAESLRSIDIAFLALGAFFAVVAFFIFTARKKINAAAAGAEEAGGVASPLKAFTSPWALFGGLAIFIYVGSEVTIGGLLTNFLSSPTILDIPEAEAGRMVSLYWGGAMVGRFIGALLLTRIRAGVLLTVNTTIAAILCLIVTQTSGETAAYAAIAVGFFNSIMFPTIFTLTLERSGAPASATSGLLCTAIVGGAVLPLIAGLIVDDAAMMFNPAFYVPLAGYVLLTVFAVACARSRTREADVVAKPSPH
ncbi:MAG: glucose/galactose MFS transporter [Brevundimonas sp.]|uniref:glucose/galactose MFS transporter n=2 Tax=Brevundimonas sp. TaxID=1871086 RepID=UPI0026178705|nr:glucose/galactose MFS transporter [Brevundimonas sp.]MDI6624357.1 glucose/galactose MFS transporter [Brevundimonas sp.]